MVSWTWSQVFSDGLRRDLQDLRGRTESVTRLVHSLIEVYYLDGVDSPKELQRAHDSLSEALSSVREAISHVEGWVGT